jgi:hypothetical protein
MMAITEEVVTEYDDDFQVNVPIGNENFSINLPAGTVVNDLIMNRIDTLY